MSRETEQALKDLSETVRWAGQMPRGLPLALVGAVADAIGQKKAALAISRSVDKRQEVRRG